jgi:hypothetical protein
MTVRPDVAELLHAGYGDRTIARRAGVSIGTVTRARAALALSPGRPGPKGPATPEDLFWLRARLLDDGHMEWTGTIHRGTTPTLRHGGRRYTAYRVAFGIAHQREPQGRVEPGCDRRGCVHPRHVEDQAMRTQYTAIFGAAA